MDKILVLGAGRFGKRAVRALAGKARKLVIVDSDPAALPFSANEGITPVCAEGISYLAGIDYLDFDWIVPALPLHVAFAWVLNRLKNTGIRAAAVPPGLDVSGCCYSENGTVYASLSGQICPEDCPEPEGYCYLTGEERTLPLYRVLSALHVGGYTAHVLRSFQLAPGVGGFAPLQLERLSASVSGSCLPGLVVTSCACHAVINAYDFV
jgi:hypothetical protein